MTQNRSDRRQFVKRSLAAAGGAAVPLYWARSLRSSEPASERLRVGCIGVGGRGTLVGNTACGLGQKIACADVDRQRAERFAGGGKCAAYTDYRKLLDRQLLTDRTAGLSGWSLGPGPWRSEELLSGSNSSFFGEEYRQVCSSTGQWGG